MIKKIFLGFLILLAVAIAIIVVVYKMYFSSDYETNVEEVRDSKGRIVEKWIAGYDCCEGYSENLIRFDTLGNKLSEVGILDHSKFRIDYYYDLQGRPQREMHYEWLQDEYVNDSLLSVDKTYRYSEPDGIRYETIVAYYPDDYDTLSIEKLVIKGRDTVSWTLLKNIRTDYEWSDSTLMYYELSKVFSDKIKKTTVTRSVVRVNPKRYHRTDI